MREFLLIIRGSGMQTMSPEEIQSMLGKFRTWVDELGPQYLTGQKLEPAGVTVREDQSVVTDGPFLEPKEIVAGFMLIRAADLAEATEIARRAPQIPWYSIEVRPLVTPLMHPID